MKITTICPYCQKKMIYIKTEKDGFFNCKDCQLSLRASVLNAMQQHNEYYKKKLNSIAVKYLRSAFKNILLEYGIPEEEINAALNKKYEYKVPYQVSNLILNKDIEEMELNHAEALQYLEVRNPHMDLVINYDTTCDINPFKDQRINVLEMPNEGYKASRR